MADETKIIRIIVDSSKAVDGTAAATRAWQNMEKQQAATVQALERMETSLGRIGGFLKAQLSLQVASFIEKITEMAKAAISAAADLGEMAEQMGITARGLQGLQYAAAQQGVELETLQTGIAKFSQKIGEAAGGSKQMIEALDALGVKILDAHGKLIPTEVLLSRVAKAITSIEDPAKRTAAQVDFFGKAGAKFAAAMADFAKGTDALATAAEQAGALIGDDQIKRLDAYIDHFKRAALEHRAFFAGLAVDVLEYLDKADAWMAGLATSLNRWLKGLGEGFEDAAAWIGDGLTKMVAMGAQFAAQFIESLATLPGAMKNVFVNAMNGAIEAVESALNKITSALSSIGIGGGGGVNLGRLDGGVSNADYLANRGMQINTAGVAAYNSVTNAKGGRSYGVILADQRQGANAAKAVNDQASAFLNGVDTLAGGGGSTAPTGARNPPPKKEGGGETPEEKYARLAQQIENTRAAQEKMTAAARAGDEAFEAQKANVDAQNKLLEIFKRQLDDTDPRLANIRDKLLEIAHGKAAEAFNVATTELGKQNVVLQAQIKLMDQAPEIQARELAIIKAKQEAEKAGNALSAEDVENRRAAIEQNERLKIQQEQLKQAQDLWTEPLKQALRDIQTLGANAFEQLLESGNFSFQSLAQTFTTILKKMAAEFLALATIRPVMSVLVDAIGATGILPQSAIAGLGYGSSLGGATGLAGSSGGGSSLLSGLGLGRLFGGGSIGSFLESPVSNLFGTTATPAGGFANVGDLLASGQTGATAAATGGLSVGGALGGIGGLGFGAYQLATAKGTGGIIGGASSILGGGLALLGPMLGLGAAAGPIGIGVGLLGAVLSNLLGSSTPAPLNSYGTGTLNYGAGGFTTAGGTYGANAEQMGTTGALGQAGQGIANVFSLLGGVKDPSKVWGLGLQSFRQDYGAGGTFQNQTSFIVGPNGEKMQWGMGSNDKDVGLSTAAGHIAAESIMGGAVGDISDNLKRALSNLSGQAAPTLDDIAKLVTEIQSFDMATKDFGKTVSDATKQTNSALDQIEASFSSLYDTATKYGLDASPIDQQKAMQLQKYGSDFAYSVNQSLLQLTDPTTAALNDLNKERQGLLDQNAVMVQRIAGYADQTVKIEEYAAAKRVQIMQQATAAMEQSLTSITDLIRQLSPGGALANGDPTSQLEGLRATYQATRAQALSGDQAAYQRYASDASAYAQASLSYYGGSTQYVGTHDQILTDALSLAGKGVNRLGDAANGNATVQQLADQVSTLAQMHTATQADLARLTALLSRYVTNKAA